MSFKELLANPELSERYNKVKQYFFLRESAYDVTSVCQLRCDGCYFFSADKSHHRDNKDPEAWRQFLAQEKARGINYVVLAGAEPALVPRVLQACYDVIPFGIIASNGLRPIDTTIGYRVHLSVWGDPDHDPLYRKRYGGQPGPDCLKAQLQNYKNDPRVIFVYTFNGQNSDQAVEVARRVTGEGQQFTFNVFSNANQMRSPLEMKDTLNRARDRMIEVMERFGDLVVYSYYNAEVHCDARSLHNLFGCIYPRAQQLAGQVTGALGTTFRSYRADLTHSPESDCCVPDIECSDCRHYGSGSAIVPSQLHLHAGTERSFRGWLDYVDTYLAVWVLGYKRSPNLYSKDDMGLLSLPDFISKGTHSFATAAKA